MAKIEEEKPFDKLDWVRIKEVTDLNQNPEEFTVKLIRKVKENPFIPIGTAATVAALSYGLWNFYQGNEKMSHWMMRARVGSQAFTICAVIGGLILAAKAK